MRDIIMEAIDLSRGSKNSWEISKDILDSIEEAGMLPPLSRKIADATPSCFIREYCDADEYYTWDEE